MRTLFAVLIFCFSCYAIAETEADVVKSMSDNPKVKLKHRLLAFDGILLGFDGGEWGGKLIFLDKQGRASQVYGGNIKGIARAGEQILVFSGLAHMAVNEGKIIELTQTASDTPTARQLVTLEGEPSTVSQVDGQTVAFRVYSGTNRDGKVIYLCKLFAHGIVSNGNACPTGSGE